jgi:hypothetical protein
MTASKRSRELSGESADISSSGNPQKSNMKRRKHYTSKTNAIDTDTAMDENEDIVALPSSSSPKFVASSNVVQGAAPTKTVPRVGTTTPNRPDKERSPAPQQADTSSSSDDQSASKTLRAKRAKAPSKTKAPPEAKKAPTAKEATKAKAVPKSKTVSTAKPASKTKATSEVLIADRSSDASDSDELSHSSEMEIENWTSRMYGEFRVLLIITGCH